MRLLLPLLVLPLLCALSSCEKARSLAARLAKKPATSENSAVASGAWIAEIPQGAYDSFRSQSGKVAIVDFHADWCGPCRQLAPILNRIVAEHGGLVVVGKVNVDQNRELAAAEGVRGIPDVRIFRDGRLVDQFTGLPPESEVRRRIETQLKGLPAPAAAPATAAGAEGQPATAEPATQPMSKDWLPPGMQRR